MRRVLPANSGGDSGVSRMLLPPEKLISGAHVHIQSYVCIWGLIPGHTDTLVPHSGEVLLKGDHDELIEEGDIVAGMPTVPHSQKGQSCSLTHL